MHPRVGVFTARDVVDLEGLGDDIADRHPRIERRVRVLEDDLHLLTQDARVAPAQLPDVTPFEEHLALRRRQQIEDHASRGRLAGTRLADEPERLALTNREIDPVDRFHVADVTREDARVDRKVFVEVADLDQIGRGVHGVAAAPLDAEPGTAAVFSS